MSKHLAETLINVGEIVVVLRQELAAVKYHKELAERDLKKAKEDVDHFRKARETDYQLGKDREEFIKKLQEDLGKHKNVNQWQAYEWRKLAELEKIFREYLRMEKLTRDFAKFHEAALKRDAERAKKKPETKIPAGSYFLPGNGND